MSNSDSEDDGDFVPPAVIEVSDSSSDEDNPQAKRQRTAFPKPTPEYVEAEKKTPEELWAKFQASVAEPEASTSNPQAAPKMVKVQKTHLFAAQRVVEVIEVPEDSVEAKKWPLWTVESPAASDDRFAGTTQATPTPPPPSTSPPSTSSPSTASKHSPPKRPGPRKPKVALAPIPSAAKPKKLTTLDKSAMDWQAHRSASGARDELDANRRGGGYLEKVEFLQRVGDRREDLLEVSKNGKRRRG